MHLMQSPSLHHWHVLWSNVIQAPNSLFKELLECASKLQIFQSLEIRATHKYSEIQETQADQAEYINNRNNNQKRATHKTHAEINTKHKIMPQRMQGRNTDCTTHNTRGLNEQSWNGTTHTHTRTCIWTVEQQEATPINIKWTKNHIIIHFLEDHLILV